MGIHLIKTEELSTTNGNLTREYVKQFNEMVGWAGDRKLQKSRLTMLDAKLKGGIWLPCKWVIAYHDGKYYRINGNHSSYTLLVNDNWPKEVKAYIEHYKCDTLADVANLWNQYDPTSSARNRNELINSVAKVRPETSELKPSNIRTTIEGLNWLYIKQRNEKSLDSEQRAYLVNSHSEYIIWADEFAKANILKRYPVMAAIYNCWKSDKDEARLFWRLVRDENHPNVNHPSRVLSRFLKQYTNHETIQKKYESVGFYVKCMLAYNANIEGTETDLKYFPKKYLNDKGSLISPLPNPIKKVKKMVSPFVEFQEDKVV